MTVTEFALIKLQPDHDELELYELVMELLEVQDTWVRSHLPHLLSNDTKRNLSNLYVAKSDPPYLLITAQWDSPEAHHKWIESEENKTGFAKLQRFFAPADDPLVLFHMTPAGRGKRHPPSFVGHACFNVTRLFVPVDEKEVVQTKYRKIEDTLRDLKVEEKIWGGWRIEKSGDEEELVVFTSHTTCPLQQAVAKMGQSLRKESYSFHHIG
jgi:hypothetical protein